MGLPCRGLGLALSCKEAWVEIKLETTCEGSGVGGEGGSHSTPKTWLQKVGPMLACSSHSGSVTLPCKKCFFLN